MGLEGFEVERNGACRALEAELVVALAVSFDGDESMSWFVGGAWCND